MTPAAVERLPAGLDGFVVRGVLTPDECASWIARAEAAGFHRPGKTPTGEWHMFAGNRQRATLTDAAMATRVWEAVRPHVGPVTHDPDAGRHSLSGHVIEAGTYVPVGVSDLLRFSKYGPGGDFSSHNDTCYAFGPTRAGMYTVLVYLSRAEGGETEFRGVDDEGREVTARVVPEPGLALVFYHHQRHAGARVTGGTKYVARSEVVCVKH